MARVALLHQWIPLLSSPTCEFSVKGKEVLWFCLVAPGMSFLFLVLLLLLLAFVWLFKNKKQNRKTNSLY